MRFDDEPEEEVHVMVCFSKTQMKLPLVPSREDVCGTCDKPVWVSLDSIQKYEAAGHRIDQLMCTECAVEHPDFATDLPAAIRRGVKAGLLDSGMGKDN